MKKINLVIAMTLCLSFLSCSKDNNTPEENTLEQLLIENSPWVFSHYKLKTIEEGENDDIEYLENEVNDSYQNSEFIFYKESIGSFENKSGNISSFA